MADPRLERISTTEITEMTAKDFQEITKDILRCGECSKCLGDSRFIDDCITFRKEPVGKCCRNFLDDCVFSVIFDRLEANESQFNSSPETPEETPRELSYSQTINFMKNRGYTHCYMCGSHLEGVDKK